MRRKVKLNQQTGDSASWNDVMKAHALGRD